MNPPKIYYDACAALCITPEKLIVKCRKRYLVEKRQVMAYLLVRNTNLTLVQIAKLIGLNDHSSVIYGAFKASDDGYREVIALRKQIEQRLRESKKLIAI